jgi:hypothetical protein
MVATAEYLPSCIEMELTEAALTVEQLIAQIQAFNPTASAEYLARFTCCALQRYLAHLTSASEPRGRAACWTRLGDTPAIIGFREPLED